jgi:hypothetical protein
MSVWTLDLFPLHHANLYSVADGVNETLAEEKPDSERVIVGLRVGAPVPEPSSSACAKASVHHRSQIVIMCVKTTIRV